MTRAEVKNGRLYVDIDVYNDGTDFLWPDLFIYYNGSDKANGNFIEKTDVIVMPYATRTISVSCKVEDDFGRGSLKNLVAVDGDNNKVLLETSS